MRKIKIIGPLKCLEYKLIIYECNSIKEIKTIKNGYELENFNENTEIALVPLYDEIYPKCIIKNPYSDNLIFYYYLFPVSKFTLTDRYYGLKLKGEINMAKYNINITNGTGEKGVLKGTYTVTGASNGYDASTLTPTNITVTDEAGTFNFTIAATGTLTLKVTEDGESSGTAIVGAKFIRCDSEGNTYGNEITTNESGEAVFNNVPFGDGAPAVYYKQTSSDGNHNFSDALQNTTLSATTETVNVTNALPSTQTLNLTDANYTNLPVTGTIDLD